MNPFKKDGQMLPEASINSVYVDDVLASDLFRPTVLTNIINENRSLLGIDESVKTTDLLHEFYASLQSEDEMVKSHAMRLAIDFGDRLASLLITLKKPSEISMKNRKNWTKMHWDYWKNIKKIYILGGLTSPVIAKTFYERIEHGLLKNDITDLQVFIQENSKNSGTQGLAKIASDGESLLFDFGQTNVKRRHIVKRNDSLVIDTVFPLIKSGYLMYKDVNQTKLKILANQLHNFIIGTIYQTIKEIGFDGDTIHMAIANYVFNGAIYPSRGGYGKLAYISDNYAMTLSKEISSLLGRKVSVHLHHDTSSMAYNFDYEPNAAVLSLGTAFGIAFIGD